MCMKRTVGLILDWNFEVIDHIKKSRWLWVDHIKKSRDLIVRTIHAADLAGLVPVLKLSCHESQFKAINIIKFNTNLLSLLTTIFSTILWCGLFLI